MPVLRIERIHRNTLGVLLIDEYRHQPACAYVFIDDEVVHAHDAQTQALSS